MAFENGRISNFEGLVTLSLTLDRVVLHTFVHHSLTSTYTPNFIEIKETFWGRTDEYLRPALLGSTLSKSRPKNGLLTLVSLASSPVVTVQFCNSGQICVNKWHLVLDGGRDHCKHDYHSCHWIQQQRSSAGTIHQRHLVTNTQSRPPAFTLQPTIMTKGRIALSSPLAVANRFVPHFRKYLNSLITQCRLSREQQGVCVEI